MNQKKYIFLLSILFIFTSSAVSSMKNNSRTYTCRLAKKCCSTEAGTCKKEFESAVKLYEHANLGIKKFFGIVKCKWTECTTKKKIKRWTITCPWINCTTQYRGQNWRRSLRAHIKRDHIKLMDFICDIDDCKKTFALREDLGRHYKSAHLNGKNQNKRALEILQEKYPKKQPLHKKKKKNEQHVESVLDEDEVEIAPDEEDIEIPAVKLQSDEVFTFDENFDENLDEALLNKFYPDMRNLELFEFEEPTDNK